jgi:hypothetical protein
MMRKKISQLKYLASVVFLISIGCRQQTNLKLCEYEKAFISIKEFNSLAFDQDEPKIEQCQTFGYDTLKSFGQIEKFKTYLCNNKIVDCSGCIALNFIYNNDSIYIPAFDVVCNCMVDIDYPRRISFHLENDSIKMYKLDHWKSMDDIEFKSYLDSIFSNTFSKYLSLWVNRKEYFNNPDSLSRWRFFDNSSRNLIVFRLSDDGQIKNLSKYFRTTFDAYLDNLEKKLKSIYGSDICNLTRNEFKTFCKAMYLPILVFKEEPLKYIPPNK